MTAPIRFRSDDALAGPAPAAAATTRVRWIVLATALLARLIVLWDVVLVHPRDWLYTRGIEMGLLADSLIHGLGYSSPFGGATGPTAFIAPGYPTLIAAIFLVSGRYSFSSAVVIMLLQLLLNLLTIWWMMKIADEIFDPRTANIAGAFWAVSIPLIFMPTIFWDTSISACAMVGVIALVLRVAQAPTLAGWAGFGGCCAIIALVNPALLPTLCAVLAWLVYRTWSATHRGPIAGLLVCVVLFAPWPIRNALRFHAFIPTRTTVGFELWMGNRPGNNGFLDESLFPMYNAKELASYVSMGELAYTQDKSATAKGYILDHPGGFFRLSVRRAFRFWAGSGNVNGSPIYVLHAVLTTLLGWLGLWFAFRRGPRSTAVLLALPMLLFPLPYYVAHAEFRYRLVIDPLMTVLAAYAVTRFVRPADEGTDVAPEVAIAAPRNAEAS